MYPAVDIDYSVCVCACRRQGLEDTVACTRTGKCWDNVQTKHMCQVMTIHMCVPNMCVLVRKACVVYGVEPRHGNCHEHRHRVQSLMLYLTVPVRSRTVGRSLGAAAVHLGGSAFPFEGESLAFACSDSRCFFRRSFGVCALSTLFSRALASSVEPSRPHRAHVEPSTSRL